MYRQFDSCLERDNPSDEIRFVGTSRVTFFLGSTLLGPVYDPVCQLVKMWPQTPCVKCAEFVLQIRSVRKSSFQFFQLYCVYFCRIRIQKKMLSCKSRGFRIIATQHLAQHSHTERSGVRRTPPCSMCNVNVNKMRERDRFQN